MNHVQKGFTLIEIMIVVAIIAILAAIAIPNFISYRETAQENTCLSNSNTLASAVAAYLAKSGTKASDLSGTQWKSKLYNASNPEKGLLKALPVCPVDASKDYEYDADKDVIKHNHGATAAAGGGEEG